MKKSPVRAPIDTLYPVAQEGEAFHTVPAPLTTELQRRLTEIGKQDVGPAQ